MSKRSLRAQVAKDTVDITERGQYTRCDGQVVDIFDALNQACQATEQFTPSELDTMVSTISSTTPSGDVVTSYAVTDETTFGAALRLVTENGERRTCALNFASAKNPGGGFLGGSQAQEEALARASGLYKCIKDQEMYNYNRKSPANGIYSHHMIYTAKVPVFRDDSDTLLDAPYLLDILTAPAVNAGHARDKGETEDAINGAMKERMHRVLALAARKKVSHLILGAYGCGVFKNHPDFVANTWKELLEGPFLNVFNHVVFAIPNPRDVNHKAFAKTFADTV